MEADYKTFIKLVSAGFIDGFLAVPPYRNGALPALEYYEAYLLSPAFKQPALLAGDYDKS